jgi:D-threo-aldose 1-dehydrogenase
METIQLGDSARRTTRLGYGCSSLMGAMGRKDSLKVLEVAYDAGIRHFDVAPMYGYGQAESCVGEFLCDRSDATVTTKYGIPAAKNRGLLVMARRIAGPVVKRLPGLKSRLARTAATVSGARTKSKFTAEEARQSLEHSLRELKRERIDVWLLHEAEADDLQDEGLLRFLEGAVANGKIGAFGVGTGADRIGALMAERSAYCRVLQYEWSVLDAEAPKVGPFRIHHRSLTEHFRHLHGSLVETLATCRRWSERTRADLADRKVLARLMLKASLEMNPASVILFSSKDAAHIHDNVRTASDDALAAPARELYALVQSEGLPGRQG